MENVDEFLEIRSISAPEPKNDGLGLLPSLWSRQRHFEAAAQQQTAMLLQPRVPQVEVADVRRLQRQATEAATSVQESNFNPDAAECGLSPERADLRYSMMKLIEDRHSPSPASLVSLTAHSAAPPLCATAGS